MSAPLTARKLDLDQFLRTCRLAGHNQIILPDMVYDLHGQEGRASRHSRCLRGITRIAQPLEHHVGFRRITARYLRNRNAWSRRLQADRPLLFVRPKPLCPTRHARTIVSTIYSGHYLPRSPRGRAVRPDAYASSPLYPRCWPACR